MEDFSDSRSGSIVVGDKVRFCDRSQQGGKLWMVLEVLPEFDRLGDRMVVGELDEFECPVKKLCGGETRLPSRKDLCLMEKGKRSTSVRMLMDFVEWQGEAKAAESSATGRRSADRGC